MRHVVCHCGASCAHAAMQQGMPGCFQLVVDRTRPAVMLGIAYMPAPCTYVALVDRVNLLLTPRPKVHLSIESGACM